MKGDFSRGHSPDRKRGENWRRVLHQQGRVLLDADVNALVDAQDHLHRLSVAGLGCDRGSPNYGYLVTSGRLYALFEFIDHVDRTAAGEEFVHRDYEQKLLDRYPSLRFAGTSTPLVVSVTLLVDLPADDGRVVLHVAGRSAGTSTITLSGTGRAAVGTMSLAGTVAPWRRSQVDLGLGPAVRELTVTVQLSNPADEVWIALVESHESISTTDTGGPWFWTAAGWYGTEGLVAELPQATGYPEVSHPDGAGAPIVSLAAMLGTGALSTGTPVLVYLETWERLVTQVEAPGLLEGALGGALDTSVRTAALGQVKVVVLPTPLDPDTTEAARRARAAFDAVIASDAVMTFTLAAGATLTDPCAVPTVDGYSGADNRLYRFEVHAGGAIGTATLKWSRDNGTPVVGVTVDSDLLVLASTSGIEDGDLLELLSDEVDLGDDAAGQVVVSGTETAFRPSSRRVGPLVQIQYVDDDVNGNPRYQALDPSTGTALTIAAVWTWPDGMPTRARRWHGVETTPADGSAIEIESGITIAVTGTDLRAGDWWAWEARVGASNLDAPSPSGPHGPERLFAPLAMLRPTLVGADTILALESWLDERYSPICALDADDIAYDGDKFGLEVDTVQEVIDYLLEREEGGGCCDLDIEPAASGDDAAILAARIADELPNGGVVCLRRGRYRWGSTLVVPTGMALTLRGCPGALIEVGAPMPAFSVSPDASLVLSDLVVYGGTPAIGSALILLGSTVQTRLLVQRSALLLSGNGTTGSIIQAGTSSMTLPPRPYQDAPLDLDANPEPPPGATVRLVDSFFAGDWVLTAETAVGELEVRSSALYAVRGCLGALQVGRVRLEGSAFRTALSPTWVATLDLASLERAPERTLSDPPLTASMANTAAILFRNANQVRVRGNTIVADYGIYWSQGVDLDLAGNSYRCGTVAIRAQQSIRLRIDGESITCDNDPSRGTGPGWGVQLPYRGRDVRISGVIARATVGIALGAEIPGIPTSSGAPEPYQFRAVSIHQNELEVGARGIVVEPGDPSAADGTWADLVIDGNLIECRTDVPSPDPTVGILVIADSDGPGGACVHVHGNSIRGVSDGIHGESWHSLVVADNRLHLTPFTDEASGLHLAALVAARVEELVFQDNQVTRLSLPDRSADSTSAGIGLSECSRARLEGNRVDPGTVVPALVVEGMGGERLRMVGNTLDGSAATIDLLDFVSLDANDFHQRVEVRSCADVVVHGNRFSGDSESLWVRDERNDPKATYRVQIVGNRAEGMIRTRPSRYGSFAWFEPITDGWDSLFRARARDGIGRLAVGRTSRSPFTVSVSSAAPSIVADVAVANLFEIFTPEFTFPELSLSYVERPWRAQVNSNLCGGLQVGWAPTGGGYTTTEDDWGSTASVDQDSKVMVAVNLIEGDFVVNGYGASATSGVVTGVVLGNGYSRGFGTDLTGASVPPRIQINQDW